MKKKVLIDGMSCMNCVRHVKGALEDIPGVKEVDVNLAEKFALVDGDITDEKIKETLTEEGYEVRGIENL